MEDRCWKSEVSDAVHHLMSVCMALCCVQHEWKEACNTVKMSVKMGANEHKWIRYGVYHESKRECMCNVLGQTHEPAFDVSMGMHVQKHMQT